MSTVIRIIFILIVLGGAAVGLYFLHKVLFPPKKNLVCSACGCMDKAYDTNVLNCLNNTCQAKCQNDANPQQCFDKCVPKTFSSCGKSTLSSTCKCEDCVDCLNKYYGDSDSQKSNCGIGLAIG